MPVPMNPGILTPADAFAWIESFTNLERGAVPFDSATYHLERMRRLLAMFDNPEQGCPLIHVAGTKGKGSTSALLASALRASGRRTGLYTSPHVSSPFERIVLAGEADQPQAVVRIARAMRDAVEAVPEEGPGGFPPTTFELYTLLAFLYFREAGCDIAVIETGIGGRLDATNVITPEASVITPLDLEHTDVLGATIGQIAAEKAGIIKPGVPAFIGLQPPLAGEVFREAARERGSPITFLVDVMGRHSRRAVAVRHTAAPRASSTGMPSISGFPCSGSSRRKTRRWRTSPCAPCIRRSRRPSSAGVSWQRGFPGEWSSRAAGRASSSTGRTRRSP